jgi:preprotein translocase subunit SecG
MIRTPSGSLRFPPVPLGREVVDRFPAFFRIKEEVLVLLADIPWWSYVLNLVLLVTGVLLILIVLIQRGKGGGLAGAFGGLGGSSAFGSRAGDTFTKITIGVAAFWILLTMVQVKVIQATAGGDREGTFGTSAPGERE